MKASLFAEDEEEGDMFQDQGLMKVSVDVSSPRLALSGAQKTSGTKHSREGGALLRRTAAVSNSDFSFWSHDLFHAPKRMRLRGRRNELIIDE